MVQIRITAVGSANLDMVNIQENSFINIKSSMLRLNRKVVSANDT